MIELQDVTKVFRSGRREVVPVRGVSLQIAAGKFVAIMGASGSGKSTLLQLMGGLTLPSTGRVIFRGTDFRALADCDLSRLRLKRIGFLFQFFHLLPTMSAVENVALPLLLGGTPSRRARTAALAALENVNLLARADHLPEELSGGEMQRVALARALINEPELILCDEPTGSLDTKSGQEILNLLVNLPQRDKRSVVMVTHDASAAVVADRVIHVRDGQIEAEEPMRGRHVRVATLA
jgi:ABC-type lipoprotein export system ATPase subunit